MKALLIILFAWLLQALMGCQEPFGHEYAIDEELEPYVEDFHHEAELRGWNLPRMNLIMLIKDDLDYRGLSLNRSGQRLIYIDREYYHRAIDYEHNPVLIEFVVFHELGHSLLGRAHSTDRVSIMNIKNVDYSGATREEFLDELFKR